MRCYVPLFFTAALAAVPVFGGEYSLNITNNVALAPITYQREARINRRAPDLSPINRRAPDLSQPQFERYEAPKLLIAPRTNLEKRLDNIWIWSRPDRDLSVFYHPAYKAQYGFEINPRSYTLETERAIEKLADEVTEEMLKDTNDIPLVTLLGDWYHRFIKHPVESKGLKVKKRNFEYNLHPAVHLSTGSHLLGIKGDFVLRTGFLPPIKSELEIFYKEYELRFKLYGWNHSDLTLRMGFDQRGESNRGVMLTVRTSS